MESQTSSATGETPDPVTETLERLEVADTLQELRRHIDELIGELSTKERASAAGSQDLSPELEGQIESLGDKVDSASNLLAELTDLLEAQTERIETIEQQLGDPDIDAYRAPESVKAPRADAAVPTFAMRPGRSEQQNRFEPRHEYGDAAVALREYLDLRLEGLEAGIRRIELRVSEIRGASEERDRQVRELEERLLILVDSGVHEPARERGRDAFRERSMRERADAIRDRHYGSLRRGPERRVRVVRQPEPPIAEPLEARPAHMPLFAHRSARAARPVFRLGPPRSRSLGYSPVERDQRYTHSEGDDQQNGSGWRGASDTPHVPLRVATPAQPVHASHVPLSVSLGAQPRAQLAGGGSLASETRTPEPADVHESAPAPAHQAALQPASLQDAASPNGTSHDAPSGDTAAHDPASRTGASPDSEATSRAMHELERLVEKDIRLKRDFAPSSTDVVRPAKAHPTVLIVDDAPDALRVLSVYLSKTGYQVVTASSAEDCLAKLRHHHVDALVLDAKLPGASGAHVCRVLRQDPAYAARRHIPVIVYTGYPDEFSSDVRTQWGADDYVVKGGDMLPLITALVRHTTAGERS